MSFNDVLTLSGLFLLIAILYSSVGFGGGSSYLALMALAGFDLMVMKTVALVCNIIVVSGNLIVFNSQNYLNFKKAAPLIIVSVPLAFAGGLFRICSFFFFILLGISLIAAGILLFLNIMNTIKVQGSDSPVLFLSGGFGLLSGMVGIGGGIFLSPLLHFLQWDKPKQIAATASLFILVNSMAGLAGHFVRSTTFTQEMYSALPAILAVLIGGQIGSRITTFKLQQKQVKSATGVLIIAAGLKILYDHLLKA